MTLVPWLLLPPTAMRMMGKGAIHDSLETLVWRRMVAGEYPLLVSVQ